MFGFEPKPAVLETAVLAVKHYTDTVLATIYKELSLQAAENTDTRRND